MKTPYTLGHIGWSPDYKSTPKLPAIGELPRRRHDPFVSENRTTPRLRTTMKNEPLPCPFCGSIPIVGPPDEHTGGTCYGWVKCESPECTVNPMAEDRREVNGDEGREYYRQLAVENWNHRMNVKSAGTDASEKNL